MTALAGIFQKILSMSLVGSYIILLVLLVRLLLRRSPRWCSYLLWAVVFLRLVLPVFPESDFSLIPRQLQMSYKMLEEQQADMNGAADWQHMSGQGANGQGMAGNAKDVSTLSAGGNINYSEPAENPAVAGNPEMAGTSGAAGNFEASVNTEVIDDPISADRIGRLPGMWQTHRSGDYLYSLVQSAGVAGILYDEQGL